MDDRASFCIHTIVQIEGGYVRDPSDPGGETKYGISKRAYPHLDIPNLTVEKAVDIYLHDYWLPTTAFKLPPPLDLYFFDAAVNQGASAAIHILQTVCKVNVDGMIGPKTLAAAHKITPHTYLSERGVRYANSSNFVRFGHGWLNRLFIICLAGSQG